jgi:hypothetical protein
LTVGAPQVLAEGWAAPLKGFMREGVLAQTLHFRSVLVNEGMAPDTVDATTLATNFADVDAARPRVRVSMPLPIVLPITGYTKQLVESHEKGSAGVALVDKLGRTLVSRPFPSWNRSILTEIYLCHACSCQEILRTETAGQAHPPPGCAEHHRGFDDQSGAEHDDRARHWQESRWRVQIQAHRSPRRQNCDALWRAVGS